MKSLIVIALVSAYGLFMRVIFGFLGDFMGIMGLAFLAMLPLVIGYLTVYFTTKKRLPNLSAFFRPWLTCIVLLVVTIALSIEGAVCWIMIFPFVAVFAGVGGVIANRRIKVKSNDDDDLTNELHNTWDHPDTLKISVLALLPLVIGFAEGDRTLSTKEMVVEEEVVIEAPISKVWKEAMSNKTTTVEERGTFLTDAFNMPHHLSTEVDSLTVGGRRKAVYERSLIFEETITQYEHERRMVLAIDVDPTKIPPTIMDEHIVIGGKYVDVLEDTYQLEPLADGKCRLKLTSRFVITSPFNWYAGLWGRYLMSDILQDVLDQIKKRAKLT